MCVEDSERFCFTIFAWVCSKAREEKGDKRNVLCLQIYRSRFCIINTPKKCIKRQKEIVGVQISWNRASGQEKSDVGPKV